MVLLSYLSATFLYTRREYITNMSRPSRLLLLFCAGTLLLTGGAIATASVGEPLWESSQLTNSSAHVVEVSNSSNYLSLDQADVRQEQYESASLDVAGAVQGDALRLQGEQRKRIVQRQLADSDDETAFHRQLLQELESNALSLEEQRHQLYRQYSSGEIDGTQLFREVVRLGVTAEQYRDITDVVQGTSISEGLSRRYSNIEGGPSLLPSAMLSRIESHLSTAGTGTTYVQAGNQSLILASVEGDSYLREAMLLGEHDRDTPEQFGSGGASEAEDAFNRAQGLYPWTVSDAFNPTLRGFGNSSVYRLTASHTHGTLRTYLDGVTTNPFYEVHEKNPFAVPVTDFTQTTNDGLRLDVQVTDPTGPMLIEVIETEDVIYNNITVSIDEQPVKTMSSGGDFYTVQPAGSFEITARTDTGQEVSVAIFPE